MSEPLFIGRWITCSERQPVSEELYVVRFQYGGGPKLETAHWCRQGHWQVFDDQVAPSHWLEPFSLADDEDSVAAAANAMFTLRFNLSSADAPSDQQLAKAALGAAGRGNP